MKNLLSSIVGNKLASDETLLEQYCAGDLAAFKVLYSRYHQGLYRFIAWRSPRRDWVEEIVQDSWAALHLVRCRPISDLGFKSYLYQIARNRLVDLLRHKQEELSEEEWEIPDFDSAETNLEQQQQHQRLHDAIRQLPTEQREALVLQQFNQMSLAEIALITEVTQETVKSRLRYAMVKLKQALQESTS